MPNFAIGTWTLRGAAWAIWTGLVVNFLTLAVAIGQLVGVLTFYEPLLGPGAESVHVRHWISYAAMALITSGYYAAAALAHVNAPAERAAS